MSEHARLIDRQVAAYNRRDIDQFVACYSVGATIVRPDGSVLASGHDEIRGLYGDLFTRSPDLKAEIRNRIDVGDTVVDEEYVTGFVGPDMPTEIHAVVAYRVEADLIAGAHLYG
jgi:hypothetical protein